ncbi:enoyl-CoA hydratase/isomerase family protein [Thermodesulfobacteriota bacterium]
MTMFEYELDEHVVIVTMNSDENRFNFPFIEGFQNILDEIENKTHATCLVVKSSHEKIWSNGIDLDWLVPAVEKEGTELHEQFQKKLFDLFSRILTYPMITTAAITGHAFAGGGIMACAFDFRFMRSDRGWLCFPEVDINIPFEPFLNEVVKKAIPMYKFIEMQLTGKRLTAQECEKHHIVEKACHIDTLMDEVLAFAKTHNKGREILKTLKTRLFKNILKEIE